MNSLIIKVYSEWMCPAISGKDKKNLCASLFNQAADDADHFLAGGQQVAELGAGVHQIFGDALERLGPSRAKCGELGADVGGIGGFVLQEGTQFPQLVIEIRDRRGGC